MPDLSDVSIASAFAKGDKFTYCNGRKEMTGFVGEIHPHNDGTLHVIHNALGDEVCFLHSDAPVVCLKGDLIIHSGAATLIVTPCFGYFFQL